MLSSIIFGIFEIYLERNHKVIYSFYKFILNKPMIRAIYERSKKDLNKSAIFDSSYISNTSVLAVG